MKKIVTIVGARPQFVKAAVISRLIADEYKDEFKEILIHTGQHYDQNMSDVFFEDMKIPKPDLNLEVGSGTHGKMTGQMLEAIEKVLMDEEPDYLMVYGDTNSTIAGALAASKLHIPVVHIEAGLRSFNMKMPEEQNRILTDHISSFLFCPTDTAVENLSREGIFNGVFRTGDIMLDASLFYRSLLNGELMDVPEQFMLITLHRAENTDDEKRLSAIVKALNRSKDMPGILPLHPRTKKMLDSFGLKFKDHIKVLDPIGYFQMLYLEEKCSCIVTDSGGVQKEAYFFKKPCITMRDQTEWVETVDSGWNTLVGADEESIYKTIGNFQIPEDYPNLYGTGTAGREILDTLKADQE